MMLLQMLLNLLNCVIQEFYSLFFILFGTNVHLTLLILGEGGITSSSDSVSDDDEDDDNDDVSSSESISKKASASLAV